MKIGIDFIKMEREIILHVTQTLPKRGGSAEQKNLRSLYRDAFKCNNIIASYVSSVINQIVTQRRLHFCITRDKTGAAIRNDKNHPHGFSFTHYSVLHNALVNDLKILEVVTPGAGGRPTHYRVINQEIRDMITIDESKQAREVEEFVKRAETKKIA